MDAINYVKAQKRMFLSGNLTVTRMMEDTMDPEVLVNDVERWAAAHPGKTRQSAFLEKWPTAKIDKDGCLDVCPYLLSDIHRNNDGFCANFGVNCWDCRHEFWGQQAD